MEEDSFGTQPEGQEDLPSPFGGSARKMYPNKAELGAVWRLLAYVFIFFVLWSLSIFLLGEILRPARSVFDPTYEFFGELASFAAAFFAAWILSQLEERPVGVYGLPARGAFGKLFGQGCLFGLCEVSALIGLIAIFGGYSFGRLTEHGAVIGKWALFWGVFFIAVGLFEEFLFRGYTLYTLAQGIGFWPAAVILSLSFGAFHLHNTGEGWVGVASVAFVGAFWSFTLKRTGSLWFAVGMHASFDFGETFLFSVPDSGNIFPGHLSGAALHGPNWLTGGTVGPEASAFDFLILTVFFLLVHYAYPAKPNEKSGEAAK